MFKRDGTISFLTKLLSINSPTGYTNNAVSFLRETIEDIGYETLTTPKGNLIVQVDGENAEVTRGLSAHVDTLGLMVRSINSDGTLSLTKLGGPLTPTLDGEYCDIITRDDKVYTGTILSKSPSIHVFKDASTKERDIDSLIVKLDERVENKEDVQNIGIQNGDIVAYDPKVVVTDSGFIKSRFLDDKASVAVLVSILKMMKQENIVPSTNLKFIFSTYEEVGHGAAWIPEDITELLAVDMGCIGLDLECMEYDVSICAKDSSGPYDYDMTTKLINFAKEKELSYAVDIYPMYGSDASAALGGGANIKAALIGPGVASSHGMERTHIDALENTFELVSEYIQN
ncbi:glutamyl aminopeptidase [Jeotgalicoccus coquinae]|uniref:Aminopeptidase FrvX n=1 Tax=Jeotgalicoccus coquinae TaxID=709509 RepID=A0A6V7R1N6_9STAP|nr:M42 family metallopeptidase [Jeotgalicoccus coquinae]MBB6423725.1 putative aminopeptidase FrvX [Jeotgalicoccus coquinae]GGE22111.1 glutamyl aminopeptidase [Jeotgalicoccus coquinae]CAD2070944.1 Putative aminopeptidase YsdC [Jeotgalicoccus coquinae]